MSPCSQVVGSHWNPEPGDTLTGEPADQSFLFPGRDARVAVETSATPSAGRALKTVCEGARPSSAPPQFPLLGNMPEDRCPSIVGSLKCTKLCHGPEKPHTGNKHLA